MRISKGDIIRCRNADNDLIGKILMASDTDPQSLAVIIPEGAIRLNGGIAITNMLPLMVNYETEAATDIWGGDWQIYVTREEPHHE